MSPGHALFFSIFLTPCLGDIIAAQSLAAQLSLTTSTSLPFPLATQATSAAQSFIVSNWSLSKGRIQNGPGNLAFIADPFPNATTLGVTPESNASQPVLQVTYPAGSYSHDTGGAQLYSLWNTSDGSVFQSMMLSYEIAFDSSFNWVKGGKVPGLRGGPNPDGCSGGNKPNGSDCFSARLMWRKNGAGEVYAYIPTPNNLCKDSGIICNSDFGTSIQRNSLSFIAGQWNRITLLLQMNDPPDVANGNLMLYYNDAQAITQSNIQFRSSNAVNIGGLYLSTFFGGSDKSWSTPQTVHTYFRDIKLWGSSKPSTLSGAQVSDGLRLETRRWRWSWAIGVCTVVIGLALSLAV